MNNKAVIMVGLASIMIIFGAYYIVSKEAKTNVEAKTYSLEDASRPKVETSETFQDMGKIKVSDAKTASFTVKNVGQEPLQLLDITTSCGCTVGQVRYQGDKSREFGMHDGGDYDQEIMPGTEAIVDVIYRPYVMPVYGEVGREVYVSTNDPENPKLVFQVKAYVE